MNKDFLKVIPEHENLPQKALFCPKGNLKQPCLKELENGPLSGLYFLVNTAVCNIDPTTPRLLNKRTPSYKVSFLLG